MAWFDLFEWTPPAEYGTSRPPKLLWTDAQQLSVFWLGGDGNWLCRQDLLVDSVAGTITPQGDPIVDTSMSLGNQLLSWVQISPSGHVLFSTEQGGSS